jgi:hypothetical protein
MRSQVIRFNYFGVVVVLSGDLERARMHARQRRSCHQDGVSDIDAWQYRSPTPCQIASRRLRRLRRCRFPAFASEVLSAEIAHKIGAVDSL